MNISNDNTCLLIQGPLSDIFQLENLSLYKNFHQIILSTNRNSVSTSKKVHDICKKYNVIINLFDNVILSNDIYNYSNIFLQTHSTLSGLSKVNSPYVVKIRTDETYNFDNLYHQLMCNKINFSNIFFRSLKNNRTFPISNNATIEAFNTILNRKYSCYRYHCSDHIIVCETQIMKNVFSLCSNICKNTNILHNICTNIDIELLSSQPYHQYCLCPEQILALCFLHVLDPNTRIDFLDKQQNKELFQKYFHIIDIENLRPYWVSAQKQLVNNIKDSKCYLSTDLNRIEELDF